MNIAYFGSPTISANLLTLLQNNSAIASKLVVTQPDKPVGKRLELSPTPVKQIAQTYGIPVFDEEIRSEENRLKLIQLLKKYEIDLCILFAYGALIPDSILQSVEHGFWNIHPSLLPLYRGASPTTYPLLLGDTETAVTLMQLVKKMDAGPIIGQTKINIPFDMMRVELEQRVPVEGAQLIANALETVKKQSLTLITQNDSQATYTRMLNKNDGYIPAPLLEKALKNEKISHAELPAILQDYLTSYPQQIPMDANRIVVNMYRGLSPWPGIWTTISTLQGTKRLQITELVINNEQFTIVKVKLEGKKETDFGTFNSAYNIFTV